MAGPLTTRIAVVAPDDIAWIRAAASTLVIDEDITAAKVVVTTADRAADLLEQAPGSAVVVIDETTDAIDPRIAHVIRRGLPLEHLFILLAALAGRRAIPAPLAELDSPAVAENARRAFLASRRLAAAADLAAAEATAIAAVTELAAADRAYCLFHDPDEGSLWSEARLRADGDDPRRSQAGLVGFASRTGVMAIADRVGQDHRWAAPIDDPPGQASDRMLVQPIVGADGTVHAVLVAVRSGRRPPFSGSDVDLLARYAALVSPFLDQLSGQHQAQALLQENQANERLFRAEAVAAQARARWGDVIRVTPRWMSSAYWVLVTLVLGGLAYVSLGTVATYSTGPAVIRATARGEVVARTAGNVTAVERAPGEVVQAGDVIARLDDENPRAALERAEQEFDSQLRNHMLDPSDSVADSALRRLRQERDAARAALDDRVVRAAASGTVADVRVHPGQHVEPGDIVASVIEGVGELEVIALLPGEDRPQLAPGMSVRLELAGYRYAYQSFPIGSVSSDVIGPSEARRVLGPEVADSLQLPGPVVLVRGRLSRDVFDADGRTLHYHDGMLGVAEVRVSVDRILFALIPGLKRL